MRATEFISEDTKKLHKDHKAVLSRAMQFHGVDQFYNIYRLGIMTAGQPGYEAPSEGPASDTPTLWAYTDEEDEMIKKSAKAMGFNNKIIVQGKSAEPKGTHTTSPVANWMKQ